MGTCSSLERYVKEYDRTYKAGVTVLPLVTLAIVVVGLSLVFGWHYNMRKPFFIKLVWGLVSLMTICMEFRWWQNNYGDDSIDW